MAQEGLDELTTYAKNEYTGKFMEKVLLKPPKERKARKTAKSAAAAATTADAESDSNSEDDDVDD